MKGMVDTDGNLIMFFSQNVHNELKPFPYWLKGLHHLHLLKNLLPEGTMVLVFHMKKLRRICVHDVCMCVCETVVNFFASCCHVRYIYLTFSCSLSPTGETGGASSWCFAGVGSLSSWLLGTCVTVVMLADDCMVANVAPWKGRDLMS